MFGDVIYRDVCCSDWTASISPASGILNNGGELQTRLWDEDRRLDKCEITDAKTFLE